MKETRVEILAPAGTYETFIAVINAGADAVYLGGAMFGARAYAGNLTEEEVINAINYAHIHNRKIYLTVNTLLKNNELFNHLYEYIKPFYEAGLDGVIVQDYGVMKFMHDNFPDMELHASTQMTITDSDYRELLHKYNVKRIVPARELSLEDIRELRANTDFDIECFVHGALCYCYSGMCLMSSFIGGRSGNRGRCAQPCRLDFSNGNILSLKDLCTLDILPDILEAGVYSLKIEGRMKSPEYAAGVTSIYRKYVDMYLEKGREGYKVDARDKERLLMLFDRGGMTNGYYVMHNGREMIANENKSSKSLEAKEQFERDINSSYVNKIMKEKVNISIKLLRNQNAIMSIDDLKGHSVSVSGAIVEAARNKSMSYEDIHKQITKFGNTDYIPDKVDIIMDEDIFISNKLLNELRRQAVASLSEEVLMPYKREASPVKYTINRTKEVRNRITARVLTASQAYAAIRAGVDRICVECELISSDEMKDIISKCRENNIKCFYGMPRVFKNEFKGMLDNPETLKELGFDGFYIRNIAEFQYLEDNKISGVRIGDYTVYSFNDLAIDVLKEYGFDELTYPVELNMKELSHLQNPDGELIVYGRIPLMVSANCIDRTTGKCHKPNASMSTITDRKGAALPYISCCRFCYNVIYNSVPVFLQDKISELERIKPAGVSLCFTDESDEIVYKYISDYKAMLAGELTQIKPPQEFTRGHFTRGVE